MEKGTILVVDDEQVMRDSLRAWLEDEGFAVDTAEDAMKALAMVKERPYDVAVLDIRMPGMDGLALQKKLREAQEGLPVVIITAHASVETAVQAMREGAYDYLMKPFPPEKLTQVIRHVMEHRRLTVENVRLRKERRNVIIMACLALVGLAALLVAPRAGSLAMPLYFLFMLCLAGVVIVLGAQLSGARQRP
ncbi:MAG: response regulator [candidate division KSB1 bacterium]|nr:response regulator [candidate division KSB1 bacterium]MDZ7293987.1 response regulator [candidate division KSB1 bacterium]MDZ7378418.1 response regulator [candidate division KSB1 bacterium]MDZ7386158.1 response regulator [candidate division KSB1 bacterium]MDZ7392777.1 response regulator [candidate division KSB1 bacterium]